MKIIKVFLRILLALVLLPVVGVIMIYLNYQMITVVTGNRIYRSVEEIPFRKYTLVMGAGNYKPEMWVNHTFNHRMQTVSELYDAKKTNTVITSGTRISDEFDEVAEMRYVLLDYGLPESSIITDYGGMRTWESVKRAAQYYKAGKVIIVSQHDQLERALFIAKFVGLDAIGLEAELSPRHHNFWTIREYLARVKCTFDCFCSVFKFT